MLENQPGEQPWYRKMRSTLRAKKEKIYNSRKNKPRFLMIAFFY